MLFQKILPSAARIFFAVVVVPVVAFLHEVEADDNAGANGTSRISFFNGDSLTGKLQDSVSAGHVRIQSPQFLQPFEFPVDSIQKIDFPETSAIEKDDQEYSFELAGGDVLFGNVLHLTSDEIEIRSRRLGDIRIQTARLRRIARGVLGPDGTRIPELVYLGPNGLSHWDQMGDSTAREEGNAIILDKRFSIVSADVGLPLKAVIECDFSWEKGSEFLLAFGVGKSDASVKQAFGLEVWEENLVARRTTDLESDVESIANMGSISRIHLLIFLNRIEGRMQVFSTEGKQLADLNVREIDPRLVTGVRLVNKKGEIRLNRLRISNWVGDMIPAVAWEKPRIHHIDGSLTLGRPTGFDATTSEFIVQDETGVETRVKLDQIANIFAPSGETPQPEGIRIQLRDGTRLTGRLEGIQGGKIQMHLPGVKELSSSPLSEVLSLNALRLPAREQKPEGGMTLQSDGLSLHGDLQNSPTENMASLNWKPSLGQPASPLAMNASAKITFQKKVQVPSGTGEKEKPGTNVSREERGEPQKNASLQGLSESCLHLQTGDTIPCRLMSITARGIHFESEITSSKFVAHELIKAVEIIRQNSSPADSEQIPYNFPPGVRIRLGGRKKTSASEMESNARKQDRLLTLPRMQKSNPPTHVICARNGDFLRGRILEMDGEKARVELRLETREIPRERIAKIIWLHPEFLTGRKSGEDSRPKEQTEGTRVHIVRRDGIRLTFYARKTADERITGINDVLGECDIHFSEIGQMLIGSAIEQAASELAFQKWKLHFAAEPLPAAEEGAGDGSGQSGLESELVGKDAPEIELKMRDGDEFRLSSRRGKLVLIDFWASWCGYCQRTLPQVKEIADEFQDRDVEFMTINLEDAPDRIDATLKRLGLKLPVAMDRDGKIGGKYNVTSIPNTMIIDRHGNIARVFVGAPENLGDRLRSSLKALLGDSPPGNPMNKNPEK